MSDYTPSIPEGLGRGPIAEGAPFSRSSSSNVEYEASFKAPLDDAALDAALLPAALCASSYTANCWAFDVAAGADPRAWTDEESMRSDPDALTRALLVAKMCSPLSAKDLPGLRMPGGASLDNGIWRNGSLASALCAVSQNPEGGPRELHLSIRGTDLALSPSKAKSAFAAVVGYFLWTYPRIEKHAASFEPLVEALAEYARTAKPPIDKIVVSGHSLGAAAAETLFPRLANLGIPAQMVGFGSPGTGSGWMAPVFAAGRLARAAAAAPLDFASDALGAIALENGALARFAIMARSAADALSPGPKSLPKTASILQFRHPNDPIPKLGSFLYQAGGQVVQAEMRIEGYLKRTRGRDLVKGIGAHACSRYFHAIEELGSMSLVPGGPGHGGMDGKPMLRQSVLARMEASSFERQVAPEDLPQAIEAARRSNIEMLAQSNPNDAAIERLRSLSKPGAIAERVRLGRIHRVFSAIAAAPDADKGKI